MRDRELIQKSPRKQYKSLGSCSYLSDLGQHVLHSPDLSLAAKAVLTTQLQLLVETFLLERASDRSVGLAI